MPTAAPSADRRSVTRPSSRGGDLDKLPAGSEDYPERDAPECPGHPKLSLFASRSRRVPRSSTFRRDDRFVKIVRLANYVAPASGGLRTALAELGAGYLAAGHEPVLVIPGARPGRQLTEQGLVVTVPGWRVPATGGYRAILARRAPPRRARGPRPPPPGGG